MSRVADRGGRRRDGCCESGGRVLHDQRMQTARDHLLDVRFERRVAALPFQRRDALREIVTKVTNLRVKRLDARIEQPDPRIEQPDTRIERPDARIERPDAGFERFDARFETAETAPDLFETQCRLSTVLRGFSTMFDAFHGEYVEKLKDFRKIAIGRHRPLRS